jgi:hypothetical protein
MNEKSAKTAQKFMAYLDLVYRSVVRNFRQSYRTISLR